MCTVIFYIFHVLHIIYVICLSSFLCPHRYPHFCGLRFLRSESVVLPFQFARLASTVETVSKDAPVTLNTQEIRITAISSMENVLVNEAGKD